MTYGYDDANRLTSVTGWDSNVKQRVDQQGTHTYVYDDLYRLDEVTYPGPSTTEYSFDASATGSR